MSNAEKIQAVLNTLDQIEVKASYDNTNKILGIHKVLMAIMDELAEAERPVEAEEVTE